MNGEATQFTGKRMRTQVAERELKIRAVPKDRKEGAQEVLVRWSHRGHGGAHRTPHAWVPSSAVGVIGHLAGRAQVSGQRVDVRGRKEDSGGPQFLRPQAGHRLLQGHMQGTSPAQESGHRTAKQDDTQPRGPCASSPPLSLEAPPSVTGPLATVCSGWLPAGPFLQLGTCRDRSHL